MSENNWWQKFWRSPTCRKCKQKIAPGEAIEKREYVETFDLFSFQPYRGYYPSYYHGECIDTNDTHNSLR